MSRLSLSARLALAAGLVTAALAQAAVAAGQDGQDATPADEQTVLEPGAARYANFCARCHGERAEGFQGPALAGTRLPFERMLKVVREPEGMMASFRLEVLSDDDVAAIYTFVRALGAPSAVPAPAYDAKPAGVAVDAPEQTQLSETGGPGRDQSDGNDSESAAGAGPDAGDGSPEPN